MVCTLEGGLPHFDDELIRAAESRRRGRGIKRQVAVQPQPDVEAADAREHGAFPDGRVPWPQARKGGKECGVCEEYVVAVENGRPLCMDLPGRVDKKEKGIDVETNLASE
ncbi:hypothetical protein COL516b_003471 [Colletotrichum fioriniae]|nr:uncharacterized protein COL516b_003471 [Colletotrichum fioriniae]KAJ0308202.1 hypothetical protein COL516b_003471 [Colletotrichum fioriniae]